MSGECDKCHEHALECRCFEEKEFRGPQIPLNRKDTRLNSTTKFNLKLEGSEDPPTLRLPYDR